MTAHTDERPPVITIDGPSGVGKGTLSLSLARELDWNFLDSGALYRILAYSVKHRSIEPNEIEQICSLISDLDIKFKVNHDGYDVILDGEDVTLAIREEWCGQLSSQLASNPDIRAELIQLQRNFRQSPGLVTDGRDMGTTIFPDAVLKLFLDADCEIRAKRRHNQLLEQGISASLEQIHRDMKERDKRDRERETSPLKAADDAILVDTTDLSVEDVFACVKQHLVHV